MDITRFFVHSKNPHQYLYVGDDYVEPYKIQKNKIIKLDTRENISLVDLRGREFRQILDDNLEGPEIGIVLNSSYFIFNIIEFDRIPVREHVRKDLIDWRIKKIFPEDIRLYEHDFFILNKKRILSVLFRKELKSKIEKLVTEAKRSLIYLGNSTIEIMNQVFKGKSSPDFFVEIDRKLLVVVFQSDSIPNFIRKFRVEKVEETKDEIMRIRSYVSTTYGIDPQTFAIVSNSTHSYLESIQQGLVSDGLKEISLKPGGFFFLPVSK